MPESELPYEPDRRQDIDSRDRIAEMLKALHDESIKRDNVQGWHSRAIVASICVVLALCGFTFGVPGIINGSYDEGSRRAEQLRQEAVVRTNQINAERKKNTYDTCVATNKRHDDTIAATRNRKLPPEVEGLIVLLVDQLAPKQPDCVKYTLDRVKG